MKRTLLLFLATGLVAFAAGCGSTSNSSPSEATKKSPSEAAQDALTKTSEIKSGHADVNASIEVGNSPGSVSFTGGGPFDTEAKGGPAMNLQFSVGGAGSQQSVGLISVNGKNYTTMGDKALEQKKSEKPLDPGQISALIAQVGDNLTNVKSTGANTYTATVDAGKIFADRLANLPIPGLGSGSGQKLAQSFKFGKADVTITVDANGYASVIDVHLPFTLGSAQGAYKVKVTLSKINEPVTIDEPTNVVSSTEALTGLGSALAGQ